ncbi:aminoglycoside phosphotransferase [Actinomadura fibrosa]|uniref:Aminoglycoside phosphotransferase n=1 Tax=Actinomadura fibrosa TaxID=111802 RepID=A0ABW2XHJ2_9ACTN|nr:aminoglycoside phosphotransferase [Actinomadura fibrosa]
MTDRLNWESVRDLIEEMTGPIQAAEPVADGLNSQIAVAVRTSRGRTFVKGLRDDHPRVWTQECEKRINPYVRHLSATLQWAVERDGWNLLGFEHLDGHAANYSPGSRDLPTIADALRRLQDVPCPDVPMKRAEQRWAAYTDTPDLFAGDRLLHTEWTPTNVLIGDRAHILDWAWPTRGAAWIDPACWAVWLIASGHTPAQAEAWAACLPSWNDAPRPGVDAFVRAQAAMWADIASADPEPWIQRLADAGRHWDTHRSAQPSTQLR